MGVLRLTVDGPGGPPTVAWLSGSAPGSWRSTVYGDATPAVGVSLSWHLELPARISTRFEFVPCAE
jgi:hypothetical protein